MKPRHQTWRFWRLVNAIVDALRFDFPCRVCGGTLANSEWHHPRWRPTIDGGRDWVCFTCFHKAAKVAGIVL